MSVANPNDVRSVGVQNQFTPTYELVVDFYISGGKMKMDVAKPIYKNTIKMDRYTIGLNLCFFIDSLEYGISSDKAITKLSTNRSDIVPKIKLSAPGTK